MYGTGYLQHTARVTVHDYGMLDGAFRYEINGKPASLTDQVKIPAIAKSLSYKESNFNKLRNNTRVDVEDVKEVIDNGGIYHDAQLKHRLHHI